MYTAPIALNSPITKKPAKRWSRRRYVAEQFGSDLSEVDAYQPTLQPFPIFNLDGRLVVVVLPSDSTGKASQAFVDRKVRMVRSCKNDGTLLFIEVDADKEGVDTAMILCDRKKS